MINNSLQGKKILIVEDDLSSRLYLNKILEKAQAVAFNAADGQEALDIAMANPELEVILMDIQLPVMDGYTTAQKIREFRHDVVIIAQTAYGLMDEKEKIMNSGFDDYLIKPIISQILIDKLLSNIDKKKAHSL